MDRLRDTNPASGSPEAELVEAIRAMEPVTASAARQQRILAAVTSQSRRRRWGGRLLLRPAIAAGVLMLAGAATAAATVGHDWVARGWHRLTGQPAAIAIQPVARPRDVSPMVKEVVPPAPAPAATPAEPALRPPVVRIAAHVPPHARPARGEDPSALVDAIRALRRDHDPQRAARLLDAYQRTYPQGALAEEALALQIEAAAALKSPRSTAFAQQYLRTYPNGRFRQTARQALTNTPP